MNLNRLIRVSSLMFLLFTMSVGAYAQRGRWDYLGQAHVDGKEDHDKIQVKNGGSFTALQLGIKGGAIEFQRVVVHFENGNDTELQIRDRIADRGKTRVIDLPGNRRRIKSVEFWYARAGWRSRPQVNLWGRR
jgi:hypothetical protein